VISTTSLTADLGGVGQQDVRDGHEMGACRMPMPFGVDSRPNKNNEVLFLKDGLAVRWWWSSL
jgi:hypothetical protein